MVCSGGHAQKQMSNVTIASTSCGRWRRIFTYSDCAIALVHDWYRL